MLLEKITLEDTKQFSSLFLDYLKQKPELKTFYNNLPTLASFEKQIQEKAFTTHKREVLHKVLVEQYKAIELTPTVQENIDLLLQPNTYTIACGHQLNIFTGPLYFVFKIISTINLAKQLKQTYPNYNFVPLYWMATEDHDFEEINHFYLFGKKQVWQQLETGAVGNIGTLSMLELLEALPEEMAEYKKHYQNNAQLSAATRALINNIFGSEGLVCLDANHVALKNQLIPILKDEVANQNAYKLVNTSTKNLQSLGYKEQIHAREINLFWMEKVLRARLDKTTNGFEYKDNEGEVHLISNERMQEVLVNECEKLSPNVVLRPLYQEIILPNLSFTGGPAEISYWLQLKSTFDHYQVPFPILLPRCFGMLVTDQLNKKLHKYNLTVSELFQDEKTIKRLTFNDVLLLDFNQEKLEIGNLQKMLQEKVKVLDPSLSGYIGAEVNKIEKILDEIEKRFTKSSEKKNEEGINQILNVKAKLFPQDELQERHENIFTFKINHPSIIQELLNTLDPLDFRFNIIYISSAN